MSVQFGRWNFDGRPVDPEYLEKAGAILAPYGPDGESAYIKDSVGILFYPFHTTKESRRETQPYLTPSGAVLTWDGRLDNRAELTGELKDVLTAGATDVEIVSAVYEKWGTDCFAKLLGDWALAIWNPSNRSLLLAKDFVGTRHLYYTVDKDQVTWSSILDPLVLLAGRTFTLEEEYIAGWLSFFPATHLTPYVGIHSVPPSCFVRVTPKGQSIQKYWDFDLKKRIRYRTDGEYEEQFRQVFRESVRRRLRSDSAILAELSGGMDSSSIVCIADQVLARGEGETPRLDTLSYYNDSEPNWNEEPYFTKVEEKRGQVGSHIDLSAHKSFTDQFQTGYFAATPGSRTCEGFGSNLQFANCIASQANRVLLTGIGGDEVAGGVPTPTPEIEDLLVRAQYRSLGHQLKVWGLNKRKPWFHLLFEAANRLFPLGSLSAQKHTKPAAWLNPDFVKRNRAALAGYPSRVKLFGGLPSLQENTLTLEAVKRQIESDALSSEPVFEKRYPFLDRDFLEFLYSIPRDQIVRPGERRSLMRRALVGIVPPEILNRKRKAFVARTPLTSIVRDCHRLSEITKHMVCEALGFVSSEEFSKALEKTSQGSEVPLVFLMRTLAVEAWLLKLARRQLLFDAPTKLETSGGKPTPESLLPWRTKRSSQLRPL
jgi:asparagine synthase (glutamine-hydrolysing)